MVTSTEYPAPHAISTAVAARSAYVHVPFCRHRCGYCNFTLVAGRDELIGAYLQAIERELSQLVTPRQVDTLYFGGGTPTHLSAEQLLQLGATVLRWHPLAAGYEWTVEANPADVTPERIAALLELGVTRLSLGGQSFRDDKLRLLERDHRGSDIARAVVLAKLHGMQVALDLIFAAPGETLSQWHDDLDTAIALEPDHISTYGLTFERGTAYWSRQSRGELQSADEELERAMYAGAMEKLVAAGFEHYEVSNFAQSGRRSRHNEVYWSGQSYFAAGPGAARYLGGVRSMNHRSTTTYLRRVLGGDSPVAESERLDPEARARELLVFGLRRLEGVSRRDFAEQTGYSIDALAGGVLARFAELGMLDTSADRVRLTREGLFISDAMWPQLL